MTKTGATLLGVVGGLAIVASIYGSIAPPAFLGGRGLLVCGLLFLIGIVIIISSIALYHKSKISTVRVAMGDEAEDDAASLTKMEYAVRHGESAEKEMPDQRKEKFTVPPEVFATLKEEQTRYSKVAKKQPVKKVVKTPTKLPSDILRAAKRGKKKKK